ncbi:hypothetical protein HRbin15_01755 [bacterium HR15]|nr:hypothetical protein HRbin15_01755 [bacterium HR15]
MRVSVAPTFLLVMRGLPLAFLAAIAFAQGGARLEPIVVESEGVAEWRKPYPQAIREATRSALQQAIESGCGVRLARFEVGQEGELRHEAQLAFAQGVILRWQPLGAPRVVDGCVYVRVKAEVVSLTQLQTAADWREVWQTVGHPPLTLTIRYFGEPALETPVRNALKAALLESLREMGVRLNSQPTAHSWQLLAEIQVEPVKRWADSDAPYALGDLFASWQAHLLLQVVPPSRTRPEGSGTTTPSALLQREAKAVSFTGDSEAVQRAVRKVVLEPHADWRITLATLWINQILDLSDRSDGSEQKEVRNHAKRDSNKPTASADGRQRAAQRPKRR